MASRLKRSLSLSAGLLAATLLVACGDADADDTSNESTSEETASSDSGDSEETHFEELTIMSPTFETTAPPADNEVELAYEELIGKKVNINWVPNVNYGDRMNVTLASNETPHIMVVQGKDPGFLNSAEAGAFWDLTDYIQDYENLSKVNEDILLNSSVNGKVYGLPRARDIMRSTAIIRSDWLENVGMDVPETVEDLYDVMHAFTYDDPDQNGQDDTTGMIMTTWTGPFDTLAVWMGAPNQWAYEDGRVIPAFDTPEYKESLDLIRKMVEEDLINADFTTLSPDDWDSSMFNGDGGVIVDVYSRAMRINNLFRDQEGVEEGQFVDITGTLKASDGNEYGQPTDGYSGFLAISKQSVPTEEELHEVLTVMDKMTSEEGVNLLNHGIEGVNYEVADDGYLEPLESELDSYLMGQMSMFGENILTMRPEGSLAETRYSLMEENEENAVFNAAAPLVSDVYATQGTQLDEIISDARVQYVAGLTGEDEWNAAVERWYSSGGQEVVDELTELYSEMN